MMSSLSAPLGCIVRWLKKRWIAYEIRGAVSDDETAPRVLYQVLFALLVEDVSYSNLQLPGFPVIIVPVKTLGQIISVTVFGE